MASNGGEDRLISAKNETDCSETTVEIRIKTLDSQTYTLRVDKCVSTSVFLFALPVHDCSMLIVSSFC